MWTMHAQLVPAMTHAPEERHHIQNLAAKLKVGVTLMQRACKESMLSSGSLARKGGCHK